MRITYRLVPVLLLVAVLAASASSAPPARGASFTVSSTVDTVDTAPGDGICADAVGSCTLRAAVMETNALPGADAISVPAGTYRLTIAPPEGQHFDVTRQVPGSVGGLMFYDSAEVVGAGSGVTVIDANSISTAATIVASQTKLVSVEMADLTIANGLAVVGPGGIAVGDPASLVLMRITLTNNDAGGGSGGGVRNNGRLEVFDSLFVGNVAQFGGAVDNRGTLSIQNSTISGNRAIISGGGVYHEYGSAALTNVTIANNTNRGVFGKVQVRNSVVGDNQVPDCMTSFGHNIVKNNEPACPLDGPGDMANVDPKLEPLADYGGPTQTHALLPGSPAINTGDNAGCPVADQRGVSRPQQGVCDIGAYEYLPPAQHLPPVFAPPAVQPTVASTPAPTAAATASTSPRPSARRTPSRTRTPTPSAVTVSDTDSDGGSSGFVVAGVAMGVIAVGAAAVGGGYYLYRRRGRASV